MLCRSREIDFPGPIHASCIANCRDEAEIATIDAQSLIVQLAYRLGLPKLLLLSHPPHISTVLFGITLDFAAP